MSANVLGSLALATGLVGYALPDDHLLRRMNVICCTLWSAHFLALGDFAGAGMMALALIMVGGRNVGCAPLSRGAWSVNLWTSAALVGGAATGQADVRTLLPVIGALLVNTGLTLCTRHVMTVMLAVGESLWLAHAFAIDSDFAAASALVGLIALAVRSLGLGQRRAPVPAR